MISYFFFLQWCYLAQFIFLVTSYDETCNTRKYYLLNTVWRWCGKPLQIFSFLRTYKKGVRGVPPKIQPDDRSQEPVEDPEPVHLARPYRKESFSSFDTGTDFLWAIVFLFYWNDSICISVIPLVLRRLNLLLIFCVCIFNGFKF